MELEFGKPHPVTLDLHHLTRCLTERPDICADYYSLVRGERFSHEANLLGHAGDDQFGLYFPCLDYDNERIRDLFELVDAAFEEVGHEVSSVRAPSLFGDDPAILTLGTETYHYSFSAIFRQDVHLTIRRFHR